MTADEYKKQYQENQNRYYIANKQAEIDNIISSINVYNVWYEKLESYINRIEEYRVELYDNRNHAETDVTTSSTYDAWIGKKKSDWWSMLGDFVLTDFVTYAESIDNLQIELRAKLSEIGGKITSLWDEIEVIKGLINQRK
ncbi:MAG: hypothetical protein J6A59_06710 [Lachnospiraceae bacterium]|nr:hypothetical protein [Lachnospiraceae bacterium]